MRGNEKGQVGLITKLFETMAEITLTAQLDLNGIPRCITCDTNDLRVTSEKAELALDGENRVVQGEYGFQALWLVKNEAQQARGPGMVVGITEGRVQLMDLLGTYECAPGDCEPVQKPHER